MISKPTMLVRSGPWSSVSGLPADKITEIDQPAGFIWLFLSIEKESAVCASHLLLGSESPSSKLRWTTRHSRSTGRTCDGSQDSINSLRSTLPRYCSMEAGGPGFFFTIKGGEGLTFLTHILSYRHGPTDLFSIGASSNATRFYLTKPHARPRREFSLPNSPFL